MACLILVYVCHLGPDGSTVFTNAVPFNPGPLSGQLSFNTTVFNAHQSVAVMTASEVCFSLRGFDNGICDILLYKASLGKHQHHLYCFKFIDIYY